MNAMADSWEETRSGKADSLVSFNLERKEKLLKLHIRMVYSVYIITTMRPRKG